MKATRFVSVFAAASVLLQGANSNLCTLRPNETDANYFGWNSIIVSNQFEVDEATDGCTSVDGDLVISNDYNGPLDLGVFVFNGTIFQPEPPGSANITSIFMPFAIYVYGIELQNMAALEMIFLPQVTEISSLILSGNSSTKVLCESLVVADIISLEASSLGVNFSRLAQVDSKLLLNAAYIGDSTLDFPSLVNASSVSFIGNMSSLNLPKLAVASIGVDEVDLYVNYGLDIFSTSSPLVVDLPSLSNASGINISGYIESISFPLLLTINGLLSIIGYSTLAVVLNTLQSVMAMSIEGQISSFSMPAIQDVQTWVEIDSSLSLDCSTPESQFAKTNSSYVAGAQSYGAAHVIHCKGFEKKHISTGAKVGIAFGVIALLALIAAVALMVFRKKKTKRNTQPAMPVSDHELDQRVSTPVERRERPPPYAESVASDIGPLAEPKSGV